MPTHRDGKKFGGDHTTYIELAAFLADVAVKLPEVNRVSPGFIKSGADMAGGSRRVKFANLPGHLLLKVRQNRSVQEMRVFTRDGQATMVALARAARDEGISICFDKNHKGA